MMRPLHATQHPIRDLGKNCEGQSLLLQGDLVDPQWQSEELRSGPPATVHQLDQEASSPVASNQDEVELYVRGRNEAVNMCEVMQDTKCCRHTKALCQESLPMTAHCQVCLHESADASWHGGE